LAALIFYPLAMFLPMLRVEQMGHGHESNLIEGVTSLLSHGQLVVGIVVLACSVLLPFSKILAMAVLALSRLRRELSAPVRAKLYHLVEITGRWSFIDLLLVALLVSILKIGDLVHVTAGPGIFAFALCVIFSLLSSTTFDQRTLWKDS
jgi:paraquat-inducible protein A